MTTSKLNIPHANVFELKHKTTALEIIAKLDVETLNKLAILAKDPIKAKEKISSNWNVIKMMF